MTCLGRRLHHTHTSSKISRSQAAITHQPGWCVLQGRERKGVERGERWKAGERNKARQGDGERKKTGGSICQNQELCRRHIAVNPAAIADKDKPDKGSSCVSSLPLLSLLSTLLLLCCHCPPPYLPHFLQISACIYPSISRLKNGVRKQIEGERAQHTPSFSLGFRPTLIHTHTPH